MNIYDDLLKIIEEAKVHNIHQDYFGCVQFEKALEHAKKEHTELEALKRYPTSKEVCEALGDFFKNSKYHSYIDTVYYSENGKYFYTEDENRNLVEMIFDNYYIHEISPHLITLIGRFYEGLEKGEGK